MTIRTAPCTWPLIGCEADGATCPHLDGLDAVAKAAVEEAATAYLWNWTRRRYGLCSVTLRPCRDDCGGSTYRGATGVPIAGTYGHTVGGSWVPVLVNGDWYNVRCGGCGSRCSCTVVHDLVLPGPVDSVTEVKVDGAALDPSAYRVDNHRRLVRLDGEGWPWCQNMAEADTEDGTWSVTYMQGTPVPAGGQIAAGTLACELAKAVCGADDCRLPTRVQTITRQGVTIGVLDTFEGLDAGKTGLWAVDSWVASVTQAASGGFYDPQARARTRRITSPPGP